MELAVIAIIIAIIVILALAIKTNSGIEATYLKIGSLLTPAERSFYGVVKQAIPLDYEVFGKVRVADVLSPNPNLKNKKGEWQRAFNKISSKHFDFILCDKDTLEVLAAIELDDKSHNSKRAKERDAFLNETCNCAELPILRFKAQKGYQIDAIRGQILESLGNEQITNEAAFNERPNVTETKEDDIKPQPESTHETPATTKIPTSKLAKKLGLKTPALLEKMTTCGYLTPTGDTHCLTEKGKESGGEFKENGRYPAHFIWPEDILIIEP